MNGNVAVHRVLVSVSEKCGVADFIRGLRGHGDVDVISTGGTLAALREAGVAARDVADVTGQPEMMDGRVKTLHPAIHGGILGRRPEDDAIMREYHIEPIDLVCVNLYPFAGMVAAGGSEAEVVEQIDIGGPCLIRAAAKNHGRVMVVTDPSQYDDVLAHLRANGGQSTIDFRKRLAAEAFALTPEYDRGIAQHMASAAGILVPLRYGENPHQKAWLHRDRTRPDEASVAHAVQHGGKELGYINLLDADAALAAVKEFDSPAACIVKHATPCGLGLGRTAGEAFAHAYASDPLAAFGGIVAFNATLDVAAATEVSSIDKLLEVIVAPRFYEEARAILHQRWKNVRLLEVGPVRREDGRTITQTGHRIFGGELVQERDVGTSERATWHTVSRRQPTDEEAEALRFVWTACKHAKSNAVVVGGRHATYGIGSGQVDRLAAAAHAVSKAGDRARGAVAASDAFFPFPDGPETLLDAGVTAIIQPGGSVKDQLTIDLVNDRGAAMVFAGRRHFRH